MRRVPNPKPLTLPFSVSLEMREFPGWHAVDRNTASNFINLSRLSPSATDLDIPMNVSYPLRVSSVELLFQSAESLGTIILSCFSFSPLLCYVR